MSEMVVAQRNVLPRTDEVERVLRKLQAQGDAPTLTAIEAAAAAAELFEKRAGAQEREEEFGRLRLHAEAALGSLAFDSPDVIEVGERRKLWCALACAWERQKLDVCIQKSTNLVTATVAQQVRDAGLTQVSRVDAENMKISQLSRAGRHSTSFGTGPGNQPSIDWRYIRLVCRERKVDPATVPPDLAGVARRRKIREAYAAQRKANVRNYHSPRERQATLYLAKSKSARLEKMYARLRQTQQAAQQALDFHGSLPEIEQAMALLDEVEGLIAALLRNWRQT